MNLGWRGLVFGLYALLLIASHLVRGLDREPVPQTEFPSVAVPRFNEDRTGGDPVRIQYVEAGERKRDQPSILLLHGSPGNKENFVSMLPTLAEKYHVIVPDLPGFGSSTHSIPDYSVRAHAHYMRELLDALDIEQVHLIGYSMGGGVVLEMTRVAPDLQVASLTLLAAIGVQELELLGRYDLNHFVHGGQLAALWLLREGVPHFGKLDNTLLGVEYARNFYDTDQRPLRAILRSLEMPVFVLHGENDFLVPPEAAVEHHRLVPHSELWLGPTDHFLVFQEGPQTSSRLLTFIGNVDRGAVQRRADASPERVLEAAKPFDPSAMAPATGSALLVWIFLLAVATLISEDLTCIGAGLLVSQGRIDFLPAVLACCLGIFIGDLLLFLAGRLLGRPALQRAPIRWWLSDSQVEQASEWFQRRGPVVILLSRFMPGARLPTYFAAGSLKTSFLSFAFYFAIAVALWTPFLVGLAMLLGERAVRGIELFERFGLWALLALGAWIFVMVRGIMPLFNYRGRREWVGRLRRWTRWEFWPPWLFYPPVVIYLVWLSIRFRSPLLFTASNPAMPASGFIMESKGDILDGLAKDDANRPWLARYLRLKPAADLETRLQAVRQFQLRTQTDYPIVLKPDAGQRGSGVAVLRNEGQVRAYLEQAPYELIVQEFVSGPEFGLFHVREPADSQGQLFSITDKQLPVLYGDGESTIEQLILADERAVCMASHYLKLQGSGSKRVPASGEAIKLVDLGTHCRGAIFLNGESVRSAELEAAVDAVSQRYEGFYFGRYDVRTPSIEALQRGEFKILELNGVTSEATHIYDPDQPLMAAYRTLFRQWEMAYKIGEQNRERGHSPASVSELIRDLSAYRKLSKQHQDPPSVA